MTPEDLALLKLDDPIWRLCNLYSVKDKETGRIVPFEPNAEQMEVINAVYVDGDKRILIIKCRQRGFSTLIAIMCLDLALFLEVSQCSIVDQTQPDAQEKIASKVKLALENIADEIREQFEFGKYNDGQIDVRPRDSGDAFSVIYGGKNARGGTNDLLHISEMGPISFEDPKRAKDIVTGAMPSAEQGITIIETTWMGGKGGHLWEFTKGALETLPEDRTEKDFRLIFVPWHTDPLYTLEGNAGQISEDCRRYLDEFKAQEGVELTPGQELWYFKVAWPLGNERYKEYPGSLEEAFKAPIEGAVYQDAVDRQRVKGFIHDFEWDRTRLVHTFWDLGAPEQTVIWYVQFVGREIHVIDHDKGLDETTTERVSRLRNGPYHLGSHYLPHDADAKQKGGRSFKQELADAGLSGIRVIPRVHRIWDGINKTLELFPRMMFHASRCEKGIEALSCYHTKVEEVSGHRTKDVVHDWSSHDADALRYIGEAMMHGMIEGNDETARESREEDFYLERVKREEAFIRNRRRRRGRVKANTGFSRR